MLFRAGLHLAFYPAVAPSAPGTALDTSPRHPTRWKTAWSHPSPPFSVPPQQEPHLFQIVSQEHEVHAAEAQLGDDQEEAHKVPGEETKIEGSLEPSPPYMSTH